MNNIKRNFWYLNSAGGNNALVDAWLQKGSSPPAATVTALNTLFDGLAPYLSLAEMIKVYALNDAGSNAISAYNFIDPDANTSTFPVSPTYHANGWIGNGSTQYINENISTYRRAGIHTNYSSMARIISSDTTSRNQYIYGGTDGIGIQCGLKPKNAGLVQMYNYNAGTTQTNSVSNDGFYANSNDGGTARGGRNSTWTTLAAIGSPSSTGRDIYTLGMNNEGSLLQPYQGGYCAFRWEGYGMTTGEMDSVRTLVNAYLTELVLI